MSELRSCDHCDGDYEIADVEPPDYEVGILGYNVFIENITFSTHDNDCPVRTMTPEEIEKIEQGLSYSWPEYESSKYEDYLTSLADLDF